MRGFLTSTLAAAALGCASAACSKTQTVSPVASNSTGYDYIVVGGGPSGIIAATRLAQTFSNKKVLLLSRGPGPTVGTGASLTVGWNDTLAPIDVPGLSTGLTLYERGNETLFSSYLCPDAPNVYSACVLGGGATINYMVFPHPPDHDFNDKWPVGWKWDDVSAAAERVWALNPGSSLPSEDGQRYDQGMYDTVSGFLHAQGWAAVDSSKDRNDKTKVYSHPNWDIGHAERVGPLRSYLPLAEQLDNFSYRVNSTVRRVLRDGSLATGVEVETEAGALETAVLNKGGRLVLAAGPWHTPKILFNSGIGPLAQIQTVANGTTGIALPPQKDWIELPVGQAIKDHPIFTFYVQTPGNWTAYNVSTAVTGRDVDSIHLYEQAGSGVLAQGYHRLLFWTSNVASDNITRYYQGSVSPQGEGLFLIKGYLTHGATSSGTMGISATGDVDYMVKPYLRDAGDREAATLFVEDMLESMASYPGWELTQGYTNASYILSAYTQGDHYVGTANIGTDPRVSVVSADDVKVWGMENLHIVDSSIHADLPTGNTQAITMVVAEKAERAICF